jgi:ABC-2 type transport system permease protein
MPLYDLSYRRSRGPRTGRFQKSLALARTSIRLLLRRRSFLLLLAACWIPAVVRAAQIYVARQFPQAPDFFTIDASTWREFLAQQVRFLPVVLVSLYAGAPAIASDVSSGALVLYLSRPFSRVDYLLGKTLPVAAAIAAVTLLPALALLTLQIALAPDLELLAREPLLPLEIVGYSLFLALYFSLAVLAVSSLCRSGRVAGAGFAAIVFGGDILLRAVLVRAGTTPPRFLSMTGAAIDSGYLFFGGASSGDAPLASALVMALSILASAFLVDRMLRSKEAVL